MIPQQTNILTKIPLKALIKLFTVDSIKTNSASLIDPSSFSTQIQNKITFCWTHFKVLKIFSETQWCTDIIDKRLKLTNNVKGMLNNYVTQNGSPMKNPLDQGLLETF